MSSSIAAHQLLEKLVTKPIDSTNFPTHFNVVLRLREALNDTRAPLKKIIDVLNAEPMVSARIVQAANAAIFYGKEPVMHVEKAVYRLGANPVRRIALGVAMTQLTKAKNLLPFANMSRLVWLHSLYTASAASVLAHHFTQINPDEALFLGLSLNLGAFYLLYQSGSLPVLHGDVDDVRDAVKRHYLALTLRVVEAIGLPEEVGQALDIQSLQSTILTETPQTIQEVIYAANVLASNRYPWIEGQSFLDVLPVACSALTVSIDSRFKDIQNSSRISGVMPCSATKSKKLTMYLDPQRVGFLIPLLPSVVRDTTLLYEAGIRYVGAIQLYITLPDGREVTIDYYTQHDERPRCFDVSRLYLDSRGQVIETVYHDPPDP